MVINYYGWSWFTGHSGVVVGAMGTNVHRTMFL